MEINHTSSLQTTRIVDIRRTHSSPHRGTAGIFLESSPRGRLIGDGPFIGIAMGMPRLGKKTKKASELLEMISSE